MAGLDPTALATLRDGSVVVLDPSGRTEAEPFFNGSYEDDYVDFLRACVDQGGDFLDIGANVGLISVPLARHQRQLRTRTFAIEPVEANYERLYRSMELNRIQGNLVVLPVSVGDHSGNVFLQRESSGSGNAWLTSRSDVSTYMSRMQCIDEISELEAADIRTVKIDVEGAEVLVLRGALAFLERQRPVILGEFNSEMMPRFGHTFLDAEALLVGYRIFSFLGPRRLIEVEARPGLGDVAMIPTEKVQNFSQMIASP